MQRLLAANELGTNKLSEIRGVLQVVLMTTLVIEVVTFFALFPGLLSVNKGTWGAHCGSRCSSLSCHTTMRDSHPMVRVCT